jgi:hypothetical protein
LISEKNVLSINQKNVNALDTIHFLNQKIITKQSSAPLITTILQNCRQLTGAFRCKPVLSGCFILNNFVITQVQSSIVPGSGLRNIKSEGFLTVNPEPANLIQSKSKKLFKSDE